MVLADQDPSSEATIRAARKLAEGFEAHLTIVGFTAMAKVDPTFRPALEATVASVCDSFKDHVLIILDNQDIASWVVDRCNSGAARLVVKTGHRTESLFYSPTDWRLMRETDVPTLFMNSGQTSRPVKRVMMTLDVENESPEQRSLDQSVAVQAQNFARLFGAELHGAVCIETSKVLSDLDLVDLHKRERAHAPEARQRIAREFGDYKIPDKNWHIHAGAPDRVLAGIAKGIKADLVVVGTVGRKRLEGLFLGNTAERLLGRLETNVLVIKN
jgi:universal stress protein E